VPRPPARRSLPFALLRAVLLLVACFARASPSAAQTILNVERLTQRETPGWHAGVEGSLDMARGNSDHTNLLAGVALGYRWPEEWLRLFAGMSYERDNDGSVDNDRYLHLRYNHDWAERLQSFHFAQVQVNRTGVLRDRFLLGSGLRLRVAQTERTTIDVGTGAMYEREGLDSARIRDDHAVLTNAMRMANLLVVHRRLRADVRFVGVAYLQPRYDDFGDTRALSDLSLLIALTNEVDLAVRWQWRHDTRPPGGVEPNDFSFTSGFTVALR